MLWTACRKSLVFRHCRRREFKALNTQAPNIREHSNSTVPALSPYLSKSDVSLPLAIASNAGSLINYGERFRSGERISSAMAESTVNTVVSKRFAKRQQMQWARRGAHLLLQTRTRALDGTLRPLFERWYPGLANDNLASAAQAAAA